MCLGVGCNYSMAHAADLAESFDQLAGAEVISSECRPGVGRRRLVAQSPLPL